MLDTKVTPGSLAIDIDSRFSLCRARADVVTLYHTNGEIGNI